MKRLFLYLGGLVALMATLAIAAVITAEKLLDSPLSVPDEGLTIQIESGASFGQVAARLEAADAIGSADLYRVLARYTGDAARIHAGEYVIKPGATHRTLLDQFTSGDVRLYSFTIIEGWTYWELLAALHADENVAATLDDDGWPDFLASLDTDAPGPEGLFLPETYRFPAGTSDRDVLRLAYELMQKTLDEEWQARAVDAPVESPYEALVLASIVEKETARADERQRIAGVFARRLAKRMRLQTDPTVIYGIGPDFNGNLTRRDLRTDTPYNTYTRRGLPPTPIAMPGRAAIHAALNPADGTELFFVATGLGDGSHKFSTTKDEHDAAVREYLARLRENRR